MTSIYTFVLLIILLGIVAQNEYQKVKLYNGALGRESRGEYCICFFLLAALLIAVAGFRYYVGSDFGGYYKAIVTKDELVSRFKELDEPIIWTITYLVRKIINDGIAVIFVESLITVGLVFYGFWQYDRGDITVTTLLYVFVGAYGFAMNGVRQGMAVALLFAFSKRGKKHWILKYLIVVFVAFLIHKSALFMFPILILAQRKINYKQILLLLISSYILPFFFEFFFQFMELRTDTQYAMREINSIRVLVAFAPVIMMIPAKNHRAFVEENSFLINIVMINAMLIFTTSSSALVNRMAQYTNIFVPVLLPKYKAIFEGMQSKTVYILVILVLYFIYWRYELGSYFVYTWSFPYWGLH